MIVLIEGGEGAGKTTCAKLLEQDFGFKYLKFPTPGTRYQETILSNNVSDETKTLAAILDFANALESVNPSEDVIMDRGPISTIAYQSPELFYDIITKHKYEWIIDRITHIVLLFVKPEIGLQRETYKNNMSKKTLKFHETVNERLKCMYNLIIGSNTSLYMHEFMTIESSTDNYSDVIKLNWTPNVIAINTTHNNTEDTYDVILERLGLE